MRGPAGEALFIVAEDGRQTRSMGRIDMAQHLLRVVDLRPGKPLGTGHGAIGQHRAVRRGGLQCKEVPNALPERIQIGDGPPPQCVVAVK